MIFHPFISCPFTVQAWNSIVKKKCPKADWDAPSPEDSVKDGFVMVLWFASALSLFYSHTLFGGLVTSLFSRTNQSSGSCFIYDSEVDKRILV